MVDMHACYVFRLHEFDSQIQWIREGMSRVVPVPLLSIFTGYELETMVGNSLEMLSFHYHMGKIHVKFGCHFLLQAFYTTCMSGLIS